VTGSAAVERRLVGTTIVTTRDEPGELDRRLALAGADVIHVPLIEIVDLVDDSELRRALDDLAAFDWLIVTSKHGARRVAAALAGHPHLRLATVGTTTAAELERRIGRRVDVIPLRQTAAELLAALPTDGAGQRVFLAQADRADQALASGLTGRGFEVCAIDAYRTLLRTPTADEREAALAADAVAFASGSAVEAWAQTIGTDTPRCVVAIGPTTAAAAHRAGLPVHAVAADHSIDGLVAAITAALAGEP
jgi:uroporphyrinogen-III synthase